MSNFNVNFVYVKYWIDKKTNLNADQNKNACTNIVFPLTLSAVAIFLFFSVFSFADSLFLFLVFTVSIFVRWLVGSVIIYPWLGGCFPGAERGFPKRNGAFSKPTRSTRLLYNPAKINQIIVRCSLRLCGKNVDVYLMVGGRFSNDGWVNLICEVFG